MLFKFTFILIIFLIYSSIEQGAYRTLPSEKT